MQRIQLCIFLREHSAIKFIDPLAPSQIESLRHFFEKGLLLIYKKNESICGGDDGPCEFIHYIKYGLVKAHTQREREHVHVILKHDELFPILRIADSTDRRVRYTALTKSKIYSVHRKEILKMLQTDLDFSNTMLACALQMYRIQADRVDNLEYQEAYQRVVNRILFMLARFASRHADGSYSLGGEFTHKLIASTLNLSRESVSREIMHLQERNLIQRLDGEMIVPNIEKLAQELKWPLSSSLWGLLKPSKGSPVRPSS